MRSAPLMPPEEQIPAASMCEPSITSMLLRSLEFDWTAHSGAVMRAPFSAFKVGRSDSFKPRTHSLAFPYTTATEVTETGLSLQTATGTKGLATILRLTVTL